MKKYIYIVLAIAFLHSCNVDEFLDVKPTGTVIPQTVQDFDQLLNNPTGSNNDGYWSNLDYIDPDVFLNDELFNRLGANDLSEIKAYKWENSLYLGNDDDPDWNRGYAKIYVFNSIIKDIDGASLEGLTEDERKRVKGEAYAQRALEYFILANEYGPAYSTNGRDAESIPMPLSPDINAKLSKETVGVVFDQILSDLKTAETLLANISAIRVNANFRPGKASVKGLLAMVSLHMGDFAAAKTYANQTLALYNFLYDFTAIDNDTPGDAWSGVNNPEFEFSGLKDKSILWSRKNKSDFAYPYNGHLYAPELLSLFDQVNDQRFALFNSRQISTITEPTSDVSPYFSYASSDKTAQAGLTVGNILLVKAEASIRDNDKAGAIDALNTLLVNRIVGYTDLTDADFADNNAVLEKVKQERRKELIGTGYYVVDLKRYHALGESIPTFTRTIDSQTFTLDPENSSYIIAVPPKVSALNPNL